MGPARVAFGNFELDEAARELRRHGALVKLQPKPFALFLHLLKNRHRVVGRDELHVAVWPDVVVSDQALSSALRDLRRALGDTDNGARIVATLRGQGFRFIGDVTRVDAVAAGALDRELKGSLCLNGETELVEREDAMQTLLAAVAAIHRGRTRVSFVRGPTGMGKTRLATELVRRVKSLAVDGFVGRCFDGDGIVPFLPWLQVVRSSLAAGRVALAREIKPALSQLAWIAPELSNAAEIDARADLEPSEARFRLFDAFRLFLLRLSEVRPLLVVLDDLQWADQASLLLFEFLIQSLTEARVHIVATFRDKPRPSRTLSRVLEVGARHAGADFVDLEGLSRESVAKLLECAARERPAPEFIEAVFGATRGNPFFVTEIAHLVSRGELDASSPHGTVPVPKRARDAIRWQLERLSQGCRSALELASVVGRQFDVAVLARAADEAPSIVFERLGEAEAAGLVTHVDERPGSFAFTHDLVREGIYRDMATAIRVRMHRQLAEALESLAHSDSQIRARDIAFHDWEGIVDDDHKALHLGRLAGE